MRRVMVMLLVIILAAASLLMKSGSLLAERGLSEGVLKIITAPLYEGSSWGILVKDLESGEVISELNADKLFVPASTTKLFTMTAGLHTFGPDYRFQTPIYRRGKVDSQGTLYGDLILVASGDVTMGGRTTPDERIAYTNMDHTEAGMDGIFEAILTETDPLAGLNELARQVAASGIKYVKGDVIIDNRLFETITSPAGITRTPMIINDNIIDFIITPSKLGESASVDYRPRTITYQVEAEVNTVSSNKEPQIEIISPSEDRIIVRGEVPEGYQPVIRVYGVEDSDSFARTLLIEALERAGVKVEAAPSGINPSHKLPKSGTYKETERVALLVSPPYTELVKLILEVSHNLGANMTPLLIAVKNGKKTLEEGLAIERDIFRKMGIQTEAISISDGAGGDRSDLISPRAVVQLLSFMRKSPHFEYFYDALPILGVDGSLTHFAGPDNAARGKVFAKTGTLIWGNLLNDRPIMIAKGLAGYMTTAKGRELVFALYVNNTPMQTVDDLGRIGSDQGRICEVMYTNN
ncbi:D-alanyl-D-alanine carboxypeptidase/D-alanyl-D-alanine-endopeptidase [Candidatus Aerophobetes bacterium Ae_b3b]|nr:MAG: D-alanyl-D-alanine carboxypeptidase/D-alanyl-D-alanine-endopeptidase [Candidatus Aerophobetes bacterium Ae_b3b]